jgi:demethylspheroidene O-methyltransferase
VAAFSNRWSEWRNRLLGDISFRRRLQRNPLSRPIARRRARELFGINAGFINSQVLAACLELDLLTLLSKHPRDPRSLAVELELNPDRLLRLLEAAGELGLTEYRPGGQWGLGAQGAVLVSDPGLLAMSLHHSALYSDLADPVALFREPRPATQLSRLWPYATTDQPDAIDAEATRRYTRLMADSQRMVAEQVLDAFSFDNFDHLLDVGGGSGAFLAAVGSANPSLDLSLLDLPGVLEHARQCFAESGMGQRVTLHGGDFHRQPLPTGHDLVSLVRILHDHDDGPAQQLLQSAHDALPPGGSVLIAEPMLGRHDRGGLIGNYFRFYLMAMGSGRPRSHREVKQMLRTAGFSGVRRHRTDVPLICSVISAKKPGDSVAPTRHASA